MVVINLSKQTDRFLGDLSYPIYNMFIGVGASLASWLITPYHSQGWVFCLGLVLTILVSILVNKCVND